jgi:hypothetical protein
MRRRLGGLVLVASVSSSALLCPPRHAGADCGVDEFSEVTTCRLSLPPLPNRATPVGDGRTSSFVWWSILLYSGSWSPFTDADSNCVRVTTDGQTNTYTYGNVYAVQLRTTAGHPVTTAKGVCVFDDNDPQLQPPPPPPSEAEFVEAARRALTVQTSLNPRVEIGGLTGLDTWLWCDGPGTVNVAVTLRGWTAEATMDPVQFTWAIGGTASGRFHADECGSEADPAASWMPETKGPYTVTLTSTWAGTWTLSYNGFLGGVFPLGPYDFAAPAVAYPVDEYRGVLTPPNTEGT